MGPGGVDGGRPPPGGLPHSHIRTAIPDVESRAGVRSAKSEGWRR